MRRLRGAAHSVDLRLFRTVAEAHSPILDALLPRLSRAANHSALWGGCAIVLWATGGRFGRRAALRGLGTLALTSALANGPLKWLSRRQRPVLDAVPIARRLARLPKTTSFPSGHSASAAAFATGAAVELPTLRIPLGAAAALVAASRVYTGVHYPSDVIAGAAVGVALGRASRSLWPVAPHEPPRMRAAASASAAEPSPDGEGLTLVVNKEAGSGGAAAAGPLLREALPGAEVIEVEIESGNELRKALDAAAEHAVALGIAGGDGSVNTAAQVAVDAGKPLAVVPAGTLNHLARDLGIDSVDDVVEAFRAGHAASMDISTIDGLVFVNTASFGSYVELVDAREKLEEKVGKWPAVLLALVRVLRRSAPVEVEIDGRPSKVWIAFIGNCRYLPAGFAPTWRERLDDGNLDVRIVDGSNPWARTRLVVSVLTGKIGRSRVYTQIVCRELHVRSLEGPLRLARDGETFDGSESFYVRKHPQRLTIYVPRPESG